jgi:hypothetical protein
MFYMLCSFTFLCFLGGSAELTAPIFLYPLGITENASYGASTRVTIPPYGAEEGPSKSAPWICPVQKLTDESYSDLTLALLEKMQTDFAHCSSEVLSTLSVLWSQFCTRGLGLTKAFAAGLLWLAVTIWFGFFKLLGSLLYGFIRNFTGPSVCLALLYCLTAAIWKISRFFLEIFPTFLFTYPVKWFWKGVFCRKNYKNERATEGFVSFAVPLKPPRSAVIELQYENGSHLGYANCIRLYSGENALVTAEHCLEGAFAHSRVTGNRLPLASFKPLFSTTEGDLAILIGPPNWEGLLAVKGANFTTADRIGRGNATFYHLEGGEWMASNAQVDGSYRRFATVLCNTEEGYSGTGFWSAKTLLGVLKGYPLEENCNFNVMAVIPAIPGVTSPEYVFESSKPQGRVFSPELIAEIEAEAVKLAEETRRLIHFKSKTGMNWADMVDEKKEAERPAETKGADQPAKPKVDSSLNEQAAAPAKTTANSDTLAADTEATPDMVSEIIKALVARINLESIEKKIIDQVATRALKRPGQNRSRYGRRGGRNKQETFPPISAPSTSGTRPPVETELAQPLASGSVVRPGSTITPVPNLRPNGGRGYAPKFQSWQRKPQGSAGPAVGQKPN